MKWPFVKKIHSTANAVCNSLVSSPEFKPSERQNSQIEKCLQIVNSEGISFGFPWIPLESDGLPWSAERGFKPTGRSTPVIP